MKTAAIFLTAALVATGASAQEIPEGRAMAEATFKSMDTSGRGFVDMGQMLNAREDVFVSMDTDENGSLSYDEFSSWGFGFQQIAEETGRVNAYNTALKILFAFYDLNGDDRLSRTEMRKSVQREFARADMNNNALLEADEFFRGNGYMLAMSAALKPDQE